MAHLKTDLHTNNENSGLANLPPSKSLDEAARKYTTNKHALGDLKNVIHNQCPPKCQKSDEVPSKSVKEYDAHNQQRNKQHHEATATQNLANAFTPPTASKDDIDIEMLDYYDFERKCCREPYKSERQIWSDMDMFDDAMLDNLIQSSFDRDDDSHDDDGDHFDLDKSESDDILNVNCSELFPAVVFSVNHDDGSDDILLPPIQLEKFDGTPLPSIELEKFDIS